MDRFVRPETRPQLLVVGLTGLIVIAVFGRSAPIIPANIDPVVYLDVVDELRSGQPFHRAIDSVFRGYGMGPVDSVLAVRSPVAFWWLASAGGNNIAWLAFLLAATAAAVILGSALERPIYAAAGIGYFAMVGMAAWTAPALWASVLVVMAVGLALRDRWIEAALMATVATSIRELAVLVLLAVLLNRLHNRSGWWAPTAGIGACGAFYLWHWNQTMPFLVDDGAGRQAQLFGTGRVPGSVIDMMSTWLPAGVVVGPILFVATVAWARRNDGLLVVAPVIGLVATGLVVHRPEWAIFVVPLTLPLGGDEIDRRIRRRRRASQPSVPPVPAVAGPALDRGR